MDTSNNEHLNIDSFLQTMSTSGIVEFFENNPEIMISYVTQSLSEGEERNLSNAMNNMINNMSQTVDISMHASRIQEDAEGYVNNMLTYVNNNTLPITDSSANNDQESDASTVSTAYSPPLHDINNTRLYAFADEEDILSSREPSPPNFDVIMRNAIDVQSDNVQADNNAEIQGERNLEQEEQSDEEQEEQSDESDEEQEEEEQSDEEQVTSPIVRRPGTLPRLSSRLAQNLINRNNQRRHGITYSNVLMNVNPTSTALSRMLFDISGNRGLPMLPPISDRAVDLLNSAEMPDFRWNNPMSINWTTPRIEQIIGRGVRIRDISNSNIRLNDIESQVNPNELREQNMTYNESTISTINEIINNYLTDLSENMSPNSLIRNVYSHLNITTEHSSEEIYAHIRHVFINRTDIVLEESLDNIINNMRFFSNSIFGTIDGMVPVDENGNEIGETVSISDFFNNRSTASLMNMFTNGEQNGNSIIDVVSNIVTNNSVGRRDNRPIDLKYCDFCELEEEYSGCTSCAICHEDYEATDKVIYLKCKHVFHQDCIVPWIAESSDTCPYCRARID